MLDRSYLMQPVPVQLIWGEEDFVIPVGHARMAHAAMPGSRLEIFENSGHMPFRDHPDRFVEVVERFIDSTQPADCDQDLLRSLLRTGIREDTAPGRSTPRRAVIDGCVPVLRMTPVTANWASLPASNSPRRQRATPEFRRDNGGGRGSELHAEPRPRFSRQAVGSPRCSWGRSGSSRAPRGC
jgi:hypothetical protein